MKLKQIIVAVLVTVAAVAVLPSTVSAASLKMAPLQYKAVLKQGEKKRGFVDISNPSGQKVIVKTSVQAFRQIDDSGSLQFYDNEQVKAGVKLDLDEFELGPREALRMFFELDSTKLPQGDVYGAIFVTTQPAKTQTAGTGQQVRLGTVLSIVNGTPGARQAEVTKLHVPLLQLSDKISGSYTVKNTADPQKTTGFYPTVKLAISPFGQTKEQASSLVFAGRSRENSFTLHSPWLGVYKISASYGSESSQSRIVFVAQPIALIVLGGVALLGVTVAVVYRSRRR